MADYKKCTQHYKLTKESLMQKHATDNKGGKYAQRSKLTFSKIRSLVTFNCKMVAIKRNSVTKKKFGSGGHFMTYYTKA